MHANSNSAARPLQWGAPRPSIDKLRKLPEDLRRLRAWLVWRLEYPADGGKPRKVPHYVNGQRRHGTEGGPDDRAGLATFDDALGAYARGGFDGIGLATLPEHGITALDLDACVTDGEIDPRVANLILGTYAEFSPSGTGIRAFYVGALADLKDNAPPDGVFRVEVFHSKGYVTVTGNVTPDCRAFGCEAEVAPLSDEVRAEHAARVASRCAVEPSRTVGGDDLARVHALATVNEQTLADLRLALHFLADRGVGDEYDDWQSVGQGLKSLGDRGLNLWIDYSSRCDKFDEREARRKWDRDLKGERTDYRTVFARAQAHGWINPAKGRTRPLAPTAGRAENEQVKPHPLAQFVDLQAEPKPPRWVIPGVVSAGVVVFAGGWGAGKTTALVPLAMVAAGLHRQGDPLAPKHWRHVVYVAEDVEQVQRIVSGMVKYGGLDLGFEQVRERFHVVEAVRMDAAYIAQVAPTYRERFGRAVEGVEVLPLVVFDTRNAIFAMEKEEDNAEASRIMATLNQQFEGLPVWLVGHIAKANLSRTDVAGLSSRGAGAWDADAQQTLFIVAEGEQRHLLIGKRRFEPRWSELSIESRAHDEAAFDEFGDLENVTLRWGVPTPSDQSRKQGREAQQELARIKAEADLQGAVLAAVESAWRAGVPINRSGVQAKVNRKKAEVVRVIDALLYEGWLHEVSIPSEMRTNPKRSSFLVALSTDEREAMLRGEPLPEGKTVIPPAMRKPESSVPPSSVGSCS